MKVPDGTQARSASHGGAKSKKCYMAGLRLGDLFPGMRSQETGQFWIHVRPSHNETNIEGSGEGWREGVSKRWEK